MISFSIGVIHKRRISSEFIGQQEERDIPWYTHSLIHLALSVGSGNDVDVIVTPVPVDYLLVVGVHWPVVLETKRKIKIKNILF